MAKSPSPTECGVCKEDFDEILKYPRILNCSHTLCSDCIQQMIQNNNKKCPFCRRKFFATDPNDLTVNHIALEFIRYLANQRMYSEDAKAADNTSGSHKISKMKKDALTTINVDASKCRELEKQADQKNKDISNLQKLLEQENTLYGNEILPKIFDIIAQNKTAIKELGYINQSSSDQIKEIRSTVKKLTGVKVKLEESKAQTFTETAVNLDEAEEVSTASAAWMKQVDESNSEDIKNLQRLGKDIEILNETSEVILQCLNSIENRIKGFKIAKNEISINNFDKKLTATALFGRSGSVNNLLTQGKVYAVQGKGRGCRYAKISMTEDSMICLHRLTDGRPPKNTHQIQYDELRRTDHTSNQKAFIQLKNISNETELGRLYIRFTNDSKRAKNFMLLCTGEARPSYADTEVLNLRNKGWKSEHVYFGDYEGKFGEGGKSLIPGAGDETGGSLRKRWLAGTVTGGRRWGDETASQFKIFTRDSHGEKLDFCFGMVESGLRILREAVFTNHNITHEVVIDDCGIVLPAT